MLLHYNFKLKDIITLTVSHSPHENVCVPASLAVLSSPTNLLPVQSKVLSNPEDGVGVTSEFMLTEFLAHFSRKTTKSKTTLSPRTVPPKLLVVINHLARERSIAAVCRSISGSGTFFVGLFIQSDIKATKTNVQSDTGLDFLRSVDREYVGFVLGSHTNVCSVPGVAKIGDHDDCSYPKCNEHSDDRPEALYRKERNTIVKTN